jgi:hypothetical protein
MKRFIVFVCASVVTFGVTTGFLVRGLVLNVNSIHKLHDLIATYKHQQSEFGVSFETAISQAEKGLNDCTGHIVFASVAIATLTAFFIYLGIRELLAFRHHRKAGV